MGYFIIRGWEYEISTRVRHGAARRLPGWNNPWKKLERGFLIRLAGVLFNIPTYILLAITLYLWLEPLIGPYLRGTAQDIPLNSAYSSGLGLRIGMILITAIVAFLLNSLYWSGYLRYIDTGKYSLFFDLATNFQLSFRMFFDDIIVAIYTVLASLIAAGLDSVFGAALAATGIGAFLAPIFLPAITFTFLSSFSGYIFGVLATETFGLEPESFRPLPPRR